MEKDEQYMFYGACFGGISSYIYGSAKIHLIKEYINETDPAMKKIIAGSNFVKLTSVETEGAVEYLKKYGNYPKSFLFFPLAFVTYEGIKIAIRKFVGNKQK